MTHTKTDLAIWNCFWNPNICLGLIRVTFHLTLDVRVDVSDNLWLFNAKCEEEICCHLTQLTLEQPILWLNAFPFPHPEKGAPIVCVKWIRIAWEVYKLHFFFQFSCMKRGRESNLSENLFSSREERKY